MSTSFSDTTGGKIFNFVIGREKKKHSHGDPSREVFETVVFVVVLVLMLKLFVAEAFVIPTGSMASTLWGDQIRATCPECGHTFPVTASVPRGGMRVTPSWTACQNCGVQFQPAKPNDWSSGDRVLVGKYAYHIGKPERFDVPVFKYPLEPYNAGEKTAMNYIKRLVGLSGETIAIYKGDLYTTTSLKYPNNPRPERHEDLWTRGNNHDIPDYTYGNDPTAVDLFEQGGFEPGGFEPVRKTPEQILTVRRLVFDLDQQPKSLTGNFKTRWHPSPDNPAGWAMQATGFQHTGTTTGWVRYHHIDAGSWQVPPGGTPTTPQQPAYILDHLAYNVVDKGRYAHYWVPDLIVDCTAEFGDDAQLVLEVSKAGDKFQAVFAGGACKLFRVPAATPDKPIPLGDAPTKIGAGKYALRFANVDSRLTVWVDGKVLAFGPAADYSPPDRQNFKETTTELNEPARIGATGNVTVSKVSLWRDVYYTCYRDNNPCGVQTFYVQPGHFFCLGDNSASSSDGREWGLVPERLLLGKAVVVYWPPSRIGVIK